ncbi:MAG: class I tRNA ligase family protein, partial [Betaproteobacteria bacterium]
SGKKDENTALERWLTSKLQHRITDVTGALEDLKTRTALQVALFETWNDLRWYIQRKGNTESKTLAEAVKVWLKLLAPFAPFICEELWSQTGEEGFISVAKWPTFDASQIDASAEEQENLVVDVMSDTNNILKAMKIVPKRICYYTPSSWKWQVYLKVLQKTTAGNPNIGDLIKECAADAGLKPHMKEVAGMVPRMVKALTKVPSERKINMINIGVTDEKSILLGAAGFFKDRFNADIAVYAEDDQQRFDPRNRASMAMPYQPAIYIE